MFAKLPPVLGLIRNSEVMVVNSDQAAGRAVSPAARTEIISSNFSEAESVIGCFNTVSRFATCNRSGYTEIDLFTFNPAAFSRTSPSRTLWKAEIGSVLTF